MTYSRAAPLLSQYGLVAFPLGGDNGKKPLVANWTKLRLSVPSSVSNFSTANTAIAMKQSNLTGPMQRWVVGDLGCGTGQIAANLARFVHRVIAVDDSGAMLNAAHTRLAEYDNVEVREGELESLPIEAGELDAAAAPPGRPGEFPLPP